MGERRLCPWWCFCVTLFIWLWYLLSAWSLDNQSSSCQEQSHRVISDISDLNIIESLCLVTADTAGHNPLIWLQLFISLCQHFTDNRTTNLTFDNNLIVVSSPTFLGWQLPALILTIWYISLLGSKKDYTFLQVL